MKLSNAFLRLAVLFALIGVGIGYYMGATHNFVAAPVHAHVNLLGWVSMFLHGLFYRAHADASVGLLPKLHFGSAVAGLLIFMPALAVEIVGPADLMALAGLGLVVGPTLVMIGMALFAIIVFRHTRGVAVPA